ncbi:serine/threonine-protein kinase [Streptomyces sp. NBC_01235]|uniref:serine/threonine-protein kinase n=1 Tax=Streptomyces sp. NBC_01235 TaxID=2903788 RepID=UPI002E110F03|nr:serine/threonine protein kinase [Streptomyces sp. NBC_01235]
MLELAGEKTETAGAYRLFAELGQGGMGRVLLGAGPDGRLLAVKQIHAEYADEDGFRARFRREVAASRRVSGACTAPVVDADPEAETPWLASVFIPGPTLSGALDEIGPLPEEAVRRLAAGLAIALADIHGAGLVHRDLKPSNVLLAEDGVRVIDFGIARAVAGGTRITHTGSLIGSPAFMAPEQASGGHITSATDVFALGSTLVAACTGRPPFAGESVPRLLYAILHDEPDLAAVPPSLRGIIAPCLAKDPSARPAPQELLATIGALAPTARPWPGALAALTAAQRAEAETLAARLPAAPATMAAAVPGAAPLRRGRWRRPLAAAAAAATVVAVSGTLALTAGRPYAMDLYHSLGLGTVPLSELEDRFQARALDCSDIRGEMDVPIGFGLSAGGGIDRRGGTWAGPDNLCVWTTSPVGTEGLATISVHWYLHLTGEGEGTGAEQAYRALEQLRARGGTRDEPALGFGDEGLWRNSAEEEFNCALSVRDGNLRVSVEVAGQRYWRDDGCQALAKQAARTAVRVLPKR